jgi:hypothetical protein
VTSTYTKRRTAEFKRDAIALVDATGRTVTETPGNSGSARSLGQHGRLHAGSTLARVSVRDAVTVQAGLSPRMGGRNSGAGQSRLNY